MKTCTKPLAIGLALFSLAATGPSWAEEPPAAPGGMPAMPGEPGDGPKNCPKERYMEEQMTQIHSELKLAPAQEADWKTWSDKVNQARADKKEARPDFEALKKLPAPERLQKLIDAGKTRDAMLETVLAATKTFYATLSPEQRKTFDDLTPFGERAPKWHHGGPRHPGM